jgi:hypothetical protein
MAGEAPYFPEEPSYNVLDLAVSETTKTLDQTFVAEHLAFRVLCFVDAVRCEKQRVARFKLPDTLFIVFELFLNTKHYASNIL